MSDSSPVLDRLEEAVSRASARLSELHLENTSLRERIAELEREAAQRAARDDAARELDSERTELVGRVEKLVAGLDELLASVES